MAKRSRRRVARGKKDHAGCIWGLISIFDFRRGHFTKKLLPDKKHGTGRHGGSGYSRSKLNLLRNSEEKHKDFGDMNEKEVRKVGSGVASIKTLVEEEMSRENSAQVEHARSVLKSQFYLRDKHKQICKNPKVTSDLHANDLRAFSTLEPCPDQMGKSSINLEQPASMAEYCVDNCECQEKQVRCKTSYLYEHPELAQKHSILQTALGNAAEALIHQKIVDMRQLNGNGAVCESKDFMDALETLNSNKELFLELLQDPDSPLLRHIQDFQNSRAGKPAKKESSKNFEGGELLREVVKTSGQCDQSVNYKLLNNKIRHYPFRKIDEPKSTKPSKKSDSSKALDRIVVLKPHPARTQNFSCMSSSPQSHHSLQHQKDIGRVSSHFSLKEIRRRLSHAIGEDKKEQHSVTSDGIFQRVPSGFHCLEDKQLSRESAGINLPIKTSSRMGHYQPTVFASRRDDKARLSACQPNIKDEFITTGTSYHRRLNLAAVAQSPSRESPVKEETRKRLFEMLYGMEKDQVLTAREISKPIGRILSPPGYNLLSPRLDLGRDEEFEEMRLSPVEQLTHENGTNLSSPSSQNLETPPSTPLIDAEWQVGEELNPEEITDIICMEESRHFDVPLEADGSAINLISEGCNNERSYMQLGSELYEEMPQLVNLSVSISPGSPPPVHKLELPQCIAESLGQPSPASVLESIISDDIMSPQSASTEPRPRQINFDEHNNLTVVVTSSVSEVNLRTFEDEKVAKFRYISTVLEASGLSCDRFLEQWYSSDQLLDPSLFDEVEASYGLTPDSAKLIFDCIDEVLVEIHEKISSSSPWMSFIKPYVRPIPVGGKFIQEVYEGIDRHHQLQVPQTLEQIVEKDMDARAWMDTRFEIEGTVIEMGDAILEDLMEETVRSQALGTSKAFQMKTNLDITPL